MRLRNLALLVLAGWWGAALALAGPGGAGTAAEPAGKAVVRGNPAAPKAGLRRSRFPVQPATLHPLNATDHYGNVLLNLMYQTLAATDVETLQHVGELARSWDISADRRTFTFHLDPRARWQDGRPLTATDVAFSFDVLTHPKLKTRAKWRAYYSNLERAEVIDAHTVRFHARSDHFRNFINIAMLRIVPRHGFPGDDPNRTPLGKAPMGSGPYRFVTWQKGNSVRLALDEKFWGRDLPHNQGRYNQRLMLTKFIAADTVALEAFKKGTLDVIALSPEQWVRETGGERFGLGAASGKPLIKLDVQNRQPRGYRYVGYNLESPLFGDKRVRRAMAHLFDRENFIAKFYHGLYIPAVGPFEANSRYSSRSVQPLAYSVPKALALLRAAGWADTDGDRLLDKDGRSFRFTVMTADPEVSVKMLTMTKENMRRAGIDLSIKVVDWTSFLQLIDEFRFDAVMLGWTRSFFPDPTALWHSKSAVKGGLNLVRYRNPEVDRLIERGTKSIPDSERIPLFRRIHEILYEDQPYTFLIEPAHILIGYQRRFQMVKPWYAYDTGMDYWWVEAPLR